MFVALAAAAAGADALPGLRGCISGGASPPVAVLERFEEAFGAKIYEGYGLSETSPAAAVNQPVFGARPGTIGHPPWGVDVEIARAEAEGRIELLPPGELGEVVVRGHNVFSGYLGRSRGHRRGARRRLVPHRGPRHQGRRRLLRIVDRKKDIIIRRRLQRLSARGRGGADAPPGIAQAAVIGLPDELHGEEVCAVVVPAPDATPDAAEVTEWSKQYLGKYKYPRRVEFADALPLGPSTKVLKRELAGAVRGRLRGHLARRCLRAPDRCNSIGARNGHHDAVAPHRLEFAALAFAALLVGFSKTAVSGANTVSLRDLRGGPARPRLHRHPAAGADRR